jgi:hypothetical protein
MIWDLLAKLMRSKGTVKVVQISEKSKKELEKPAPGELSGLMIGIARI